MAHGMKSKGLICCILVASLFCASFADNKVTNLTMIVIGSAKLAETDDSFVCGTLDWWPRTKCDFGRCSWGEAGILNLDLDNKILVNAVKAFVNLRIRVGGSLQDQVVYKVGTFHENCSDFKLKDGGLFGFSTGCLDMKRWDLMNKFFNETGAVITFGLNALNGRNKSTSNDTLMVGAWNYTNALEFMSYTASKGYKIDSYELGPNVVDGVTYHVYNLGPGDHDLDVLKNVLDPDVVEGANNTYYNIKTDIQSFGSRPWVSESGGAWSSGSKNVSRTFANGFCALLWHRLMGKKVLFAYHVGSKYLRVYAHCSKNNNV
ncbi:heparanase-like protein 1 [Phtheirospermum japonicum]|uniref:Heparanase-like protein 1 n=1 Tax=Phtheirospermum japonicum TaxID=374723 RepID=A0A830BUL5_9LAMI|nr:heparanase-like protein 1 [Phtheirospermum japonicum]